MKYTIMGFSQKRSVELNLSVEDLAILRWFIDFYSTDHMRKFQASGKEYVLVNYKHFLEDMPIFKCTKKTLATKFRHLVDANVLEYRLIKDYGTFSVYRIGPEYESLTCGYENGGEIFTPVTEKSVTPLPKNRQPVTEKSVTKDQSTIYPSTNNNIEESNDSSCMSKAKDFDPKSTDTPYGKITELYSEICKSYPKMKMLSDTRKKSIKARLSSGYSVEDFKLLFEKAESSRFLKGGNSRNWKATFDWLIKDANMAKVLDGNYDDKGEDFGTNEPVRDHKKSRFNVTRL